MIFIRDIERCPYVPKDPEYDEWSKKDKARLDKLVEDRKELLKIARLYAITDVNLDNDIVNLSKFVVWVLDRNEML